MSRDTTYLAKLVEYAVKVDQYLALSDLCDVVHCLAGIVANPGILVREACQDRGHDLGEVPR